MGIWDVFQKYVEGMNKDDVIWYQNDYDAVKNGNKHHAHPEVVSHLGVIRKAIETPNEVRQDKDSSNKRCYYAWFSGDKTYPNNHMKVVIALTWYGKLKVVTAYFTNHLSSNEQTIWPNTQTQMKN